MNLNEYHIIHYLYTYLYTDQKQLNIILNIKLYFKNK